MGRFDRAYVYNAAKRDHTKPMIITYKGERRRQLWPAGTVERFVNLQGSVVQSVLVPPGMPATTEAVAQARAKLHALKTTGGDVVGFIEHGRCPLRTGVADLNAVIGEECERMRNEIGPPCKDHPVTMRRTAKGIEYFDGCPHVQWLITERRKIHKAKLDARMKRQKTIQEIEQAKLAAAEQQASDTRALLEKVVEKMDAQQPRARKQAQQEPSE
jgi:hypothetical protein